MVNNNKGRVLGVIILIFVLIFLLINCAKLIQQSTDVFVVENGSLSYEESVQGYIIRDEIVLKGENYKNGMVQLKTEGEKVSNGESVFRYYSNGEENLNKQIEELDLKINEALEKNGTSFLDADVFSLEQQIQVVLTQMNDVNDLEKQDEYLKKIDSYITKKANIAGELSPAGSYVKQLIEQRNSLKNQLNQNSEIVRTNKAGVISYRVDGCEEILGVKDFSYLNTKFLNDLNLEVGTTIPQNLEQGKVINNFSCYIACPIASEMAMEAKVGDTVTLRLSNFSEVISTIEHIVEEENSRIIVFKIKKNIKELIEYRKISFEIIWWNFSGWKISNSAIKEENDLSYVYRNKAGYTEKILVKVLRQNDTFSIVTNYTKDELTELGFSSKEIEEMQNIKIYDEILLSK